MDANATAMVTASFVADSLALGAHWIYDTDVIDRTIGRVDRLLAPPAGSFHPTKGKGAFTHYGDQAMILLESLAAHGGFDVAAFARDWRASFDSYDGYVDHATTDTLERFRAGNGPDSAGSDSMDLGGAARIAPLVYRYRNDPERLLESTAAQTAMTHNRIAVVRAAEYLARVALAVLGGTHPVDALEAVRGDGFQRGDFGKYVADGLGSAGNDTRRTIMGFGQHCGTAAALPSVVHLIATYPDDLETALTENVMAGGDSAARGMAVGMILGAALGPDAVPDAWLSELRARAAIEDLIRRMAL